VKEEEGEFSCVLSFVLQGADCREVGAGGDEVAGDLQEPLQLHQP
jgi:hypothetical protein